jgi:hypothetical protein
MNKFLKMPSLPCIISSLMKLKASYALNIEGEAWMHFLHKYQSKEARMCAHFG